MSKHTPGPWFANRAIGTNNSDCGWHIEPECIDYQYRGTVCSLNDAEHIGGVTKTERDANARLITAAPELLAALEDLADAVMSMQSTFGVIRGKTPEHEDIYTHEQWAEEFLHERAAAARAVVAKATGRDA